MKKIFPKVKKEIPKLKIYIVGSKPKKEIRSWHNGFDIEVVGFADDLREYIKKAAVVICPIRVGGGTRNKILQAWALRRPVVTTSIGREGLAGENGNHFLIADNPKNFAACIIQILKNPKLNNSLAEAGRKMVEENYNMKAITKDLEKILWSL